MPDERSKGGPQETRREYTDRFGEHAPAELLHQFYCPPLNIPENGGHLWEWFFDIRDSVEKVRDGNSALIPPSEYTSWAVLTGRVVYPSEWSILRAMDRAYCAGFNVELQESRARREEWAKGS